MNRKLKAACVLILVSGMLGIVFAVSQDAATNVAPSVSQGSDPIWKKILFGALGGIMAAFIGWAKNRDNKSNAQEPFSLKYFGITVVIGAVIGAIAGACGKTIPEFFNQYESLPVWGFAMMGVEALLKAVFRQSIGIAKFLGLIKRGASNPPSPVPPPTTPPQP